jgi:hypothetical protein
MPPIASADLLAHVVNSLSTRTLTHFAEEAKLDGESLSDALSRYEIDYAWHVLGSDRLRDETVAQLAALQQAPASAAQQACIAQVLQSAAAAQPADVLMSFDNDVSAALAARLVAA